MKNGPRGGVAYHSFFQATGSGILRGRGKQVFGMVIVIIGFTIGLAVGVPLELKYRSIICKYFALCRRFSIQQ